MKGQSVKQLQNSLKRKTDKVKKLDTELKSEKAAIAMFKKEIADAKKKEAEEKAKAKAKAKPKAKAKAKPKAKKKS